MGLHHHMSLIRRAVRCVELNWSSSKGAGKITNRSITRPAGNPGRQRLFSGAHQIERSGFTCVIDPDELCSRAGLLECICNDDRNGLVIMLNLRTAEEPRSVQAALAKLSCILGGDDGADAWRGPSAGDVHRPDAALCNGRSN